MFFFNQDCNCLYSANMASLIIPIHFFAYWLLNAFVPAYAVLNNLPNLSSSNNKPFGIWDIFEIFMDFNGYLLSRYQQSALDDCTGEGLLTFLHWRPFWVDIFYVNVINIAALYLSYSFNVDSSKILNVMYSWHWITFQIRNESVTAFSITEPI